MRHEGRDDRLEALLPEQVAYYRARAPGYTETALPDLSDHELSIVRWCSIPSRSSKIHFVGVD